MPSFPYQEISKVSWCVCVYVFIIIILVHHVTKNICDVTKNICVLLTHSRFLISNFRLVLNVVCFVLGNFPASEFYMPTFRNTLFHLHRPMKMEQTGFFETSAYKIQTPGNYPEQSKEHSLLFIMKFCYL
jgi:hypothetical protein